MGDQLKRWSRLLHLDVLLVLLALLAGIAGAYLAHRYLGARADAAETAIRNRYKTMSVVVAASDLARGETLQAGLLAARQMPLEFLPSDAVPAAHAGELIGGRTAIDIRRGMPVVRAALAAASTTPRLSSVLSGTGRALTIAVDEVNSQSGNLRAGDWVDIYYSRNEGGGAVLMQLLQRVQVLAAGAVIGLADDAAETAGTERHYGTITLAVSAADAERVVLAQQSGSLSVVLRSRDDQSLLPSVTRSSRWLLEQRDAQAAVIPGSRVEVLVGGNGGLTPERTWLRIGRTDEGPAGDRS